MLVLKKTDVFIRANKLKNKLMLNIFGNVKNAFIIYMHHKDACNFTAMHNRTSAHNFSIAVCHWEQKKCQINGEHQFLR